MKLTRLLAIAFCCFSAAGASANDLTDYLPIYNLAHTKFIPAQTRYIYDNNIDYEGYQAEYDFDENGHLTAIYSAGYMSGEGGAEIFKWSRDGRLISSKGEFHGSDIYLNHEETTFTSDAKGRVTGYEKVRYFSTPPEIIHQKLNRIKCEYTYDSKGNCTQVTIDDDGVCWNYEKGAAEVYDPSHTEIIYEYDPNDLLVKAVKTVNAQETENETFEYEKVQNMQFEEVYYLSRSVYTLPSYGEPSRKGTITTEYVHYGADDVPSGYIMYGTFKNMGVPDETRECIQVRTFAGLPLRVTEKP